MNDFYDLSNVDGYNVGSTALHYEWGLAVKSPSTSSVFTKKPQHVFFWYFRTNLFFPSRFFPICSPKCTQNVFNLIKAHTFGGSFFPWVSSKNQTHAFSRFLLRFSSCRCFSSCSCFFFLKGILTLLKRNGLFAKIGNHISAYSLHFFFFPFGIVCLFLRKSTRVFWFVWRVPCPDQGRAVQFWAIWPKPHPHPEYWVSKAYPSMAPNLIFNSTHFFIPRLYATSQTPFCGQFGTVSDLCQLSKAYSGVSKGYPPGTEQWQWSSCARTKYIGKDALGWRARQKWREIKVNEAD